MRKCNETEDRLNEMH